MAAIDPEMDRAFPFGDPNNCLVISNKMSVKPLQVIADNNLQLKTD